MGRMFHTENVSNVKVCVRTKHLVIYLQVDVMTVAVITGLESFVKVVELFVHEWCLVAIKKIGLFIEI